MKEKSVVDKINEANVAKYGKIKPCCEMYPPFCRCESAKTKSPFGPPDISELISDYPFDPLSPPIRLVGDKSGSWIPGRKQTANKKSLLQRLMFWK